MKKRILSIFLTLTMVVTMIPFYTVAQEVDTSTRYVCINYNGANFTGEGEGTAWNYITSLNYLNLNQGYTFTFTGTAVNKSVENNGTISDGLFSSKVDNTGTINGGTFSGDVGNGEGATISDGLFSSKVDNTGTISDGTFSGSVKNAPGGTINGGTFSGDVNNSSKINGGYFHKEISGSAIGASIATDGKVKYLYTETLTGLTSSSDSFEIFIDNFGDNKFIAYQGDDTTAEISFTANTDYFLPAKVKVNSIDTAVTDGKVTITADKPIVLEAKAVPTNIEITYDGNNFTGDGEGTAWELINGQLKLESGFNFILKGTVVDKIVDNSATIANGTFEGTVYNKSGATINDGTFKRDVYNSFGATINDGTFEGDVSNYGMISDGTVKGGVTNYGSATINDGTFEANVTNSGTIDGGYFHNAIESNSGTIATGGNVKFLYDESLTNLTSSGSDIETVGTDKFIAYKGANGTSITLTAGTGYNLPAAVKINNTDTNITGGKVAFTADKPITLVGTGVKTSTPTPTPTVAPTPTPTPTSTVAPTPTPTPTSTSTSTSTPSPTSTPTPKIKVEIPKILQSDYAHTGSEIEVKLSSFDSNIIEVTGNKATEIGEYKVVLGLKDTSKYEWNTETNKEGKWQYTWKIIENKPKTEVSDSNTGIKVKGEDGTTFDPETSLEVIPQPEGSYPLYKDKIEALVKGKEVVVLYDISLMKDGVKIQPNGKIRIEIPLTAEQLAYENPQAIYIDNDGNVSIVENAWIENGKLIIITDHFSVYGAIGTKKAASVSTPTAKPTVTPSPNPATGDTTNFTWLYIVLGAAVLGIITTLFVRKKRTK